MEGAAERQEELDVSAGAKGEDEDARCRAL
jgi:hypothetical protein